MATPPETDPKQDVKAQRSATNASELVALFTDYDCPYTPYEGRALRASLAGDVLFIYLGKLTEDRDGLSFKSDDEATVGVNAQEFYETLGTMLRRADRRDVERLREGTLPSDHPNFTVAHETVPVAAIRKRA